MKVNLNETKNFDDAFEEFIDSRKARNLREGTIRHYRESYKSITRFIPPNKDIKDFDKKTVDDFIKDCSKLEISSQTLYTYTRDLKTFMYWFMKMDYIPSFKIQLPVVDKHTIETYTDAELRILLKKPTSNNISFNEYRSWVIVNFLMSTGVRLNSLINIKAKDVDFENEVVYINMTKNRRPMILPLNKDITKILKKYMQIRQCKTGEDYIFCTCYEGKCTRGTIVQSLSKYNKDRGIVKTGIHRYRHTFAKKWILKGGSVVTLQKILGHSSLLITENYINLLVSDLKKDIDKFNIIEEFKNNYITMNTDINNL